MVLTTMSMFEKTALIAVILSCCCCLTRPEVLIEESSAVENVQGPLGGSVELPCDVTPVLLGDRVALVIWYKLGHDAPVYSFDTRDGVTSHWSDPSTLAARATFRSDPEPAALVLTRLRPEDSGQYRCRVDFIKSPTKNTILNLKVLFPPERLQILNHEGVEVHGGVLGPYDEGTSVNVTCVAVGGRPVARVSWWRSHALLANSAARATVAFTLQRSDLAATLTCQAVTDPSIPPVSESISIDVNLPALWLRMEGGHQPLVAGQATQLACQAAGARPQPTISWWKDGTRLQGARESVSTDGNVTRSVFTLVPSLQDAGRVISCRVVQPALSRHALDDGWKMEILHVPVVAVSLGGHLVGERVLERSDVYLDCTVRANPPHTALYFKHNGVIIKPGPGVVVANQSLVLQHVSRIAAGDYHCVASNSLGEGNSDVLTLDVQYAPTCKSARASIVRAVIGDQVDVDCDLDANPMEPLAYQWRFNSSSHRKRALPNTMLSLSHRNMKYLVNSSSDYGWLQCSATNSVGPQHSPCLFQLLPADKPSPVRGCEITNVSYDSFILNCTPGHDGGIPQTFLLEITETSTGVLLCNMTQSAPWFVARGLQASHSLTARVTALNKRGASEPMVLAATLLQQPQNYVGAVQEAMSPALVASAAASVVALLAVAAVSFTACFYVKQKSSARYDGSDKKQRDKTSDMPLTSNKDTKSADISDKNPDIIPLERKANINCLSRSSITDQSSIQLLTPDKETNSIPSNFQRHDDHNLECDQYICGYLSEHRVPLKYQTIPNIGPKIQKNNPINSEVLNSVGEAYQRYPDTDWFKYRNSLLVNPSKLLPPEHLMPLYSPSLSGDRRGPQLYHTQELEHRHHPNSRHCSNSSSVRLLNRGVYFNNTVADESRNFLEH